MKDLRPHQTRTLTLIATLTLVAASLQPAQARMRGSVNANVNRPTVNINNRPNINSRPNINTRPNINQNVNRDINVNHNANIKIDRDIDVDVNNRYHHNNNGFGAGLVAGAIIGAAVASPPRGYTTVYVHGAPYAYYSGAYYQTTTTGYVVVEPPVGAVVPTLPAGATATTINGVTYFIYEGIYYQPVMVSGVTQYRTVKL